ncbi:hypothetical protein GCM10023231_36130 [Olivibacter ginsenosidimutans]|uniref:Uncharacterized protein n=1 Tax=Olivibacter ginsenosidimutans TaxID=1176537 RepID=A0ABP9C352_9SPHI
MRLFKILNVIILIGFINTITYFPCYLNINLSDQEYLFNEAKEKDFDGDTLLECLFDDVLDLPMTGKDESPIIFYDNFSFLTHIISIVVKVLDSFILSIKPITHSLLSQESYFVSKITPLLGYYIFLFRFKPF